MLLPSKNTTVRYTYDIPTRGDELKSSTFLRQKRGTPNTQGTPFPLEQGGAGIPPYNPYNRA